MPVPGALRHRACPVVIPDFVVIARSEATKQSRVSDAVLDCFASLAMTELIPIQLKIVAR
jgi:hypothetical protein